MICPHCKKELTPEQVASLLGSITSKAKKISSAKNGKLGLVGHEPTNGKHPRNFMVDKNGEFVLVGNMNTDNVVIFNRDSKTGKLKPNGVQYTVPGITCLIQL